MTTETEKTEVTDKTDKTADKTDNVDVTKPTETSTKLKEVKTSIIKAYFDKWDKEKGLLFFGIKGLSFNPKRKQQAEALLNPTTITTSTDFSLDTIGASIDKAKETATETLKEKFVSSVTDQKDFTYDATSLAGLQEALKDLDTKTEKDLTTLQGSIDDADDITKVVPIDKTSPTDKTVSTDNTTKSTETKLAAGAGVVAGTVVAGAAANASAPESKEISTTYVAPFEKTEHTFIMSPFGERNGEEHDGIDISAPAGTAVKSIIRGEVLETGYSDAMNHYVKIQTTDKKKTLIFMHLKNDLPFKKGDTVKPGDVIGYVGVQAVSRYRTGTHLHLGVYDDVEKKYIDPEKDDDLKKIVDKYPVYTA